MRATKHTGWFVCPICGGEYDRGYKVDFNDGTRQPICKRCYELFVKGIKRMIRRSDRQYKKGKVVSFEEAWRKLEDKVKEREDAKNKS